MYFFVHSFSLVSSNMYLCKDQFTNIYRFYFYKLWWKEKKMGEKKTGKDDDD